MARTSPVVAEQDRRTAILDAVERLMSRGGVQAITMRAVAEEADVSLRLVQYYGSSKDELVRATLRRLADRSVRDWQARTATVAECGHDVVAALGGFFAEALPTDERSRSFHRVGVSLELLATTEPESPAAGAYRAHLHALADHLAQLVTTGSALGSTEARRIASEVMSLAHGLGTLLMTGALTESDAGSLVEDYLNRLRPRLRP